MLRNSASSAESSASSAVQRSLCPGKFAGRWKDGFFLRHHFEDSVLAVVDVVNELANEGLMVFLAQGLVALREIIALLHFQTFERRNQFWRVVAALKTGLLDAELERVHRL